MKQSMEVTTVNSSTVVYVGHEVIEGIPLTAVVFARQEGEAGYLYHDPDMALHDGILAAESAGSYVNEVKNDYEFLRMSTCYPQTLGNHGKIMLKVGDLSVDAIMEAVGTLTAEQVSELSDPTDAYFILPGDAGDDVVSGLREALGSQGIERGRVVRNRVMGDKAVWVANIDGLVLNFTVDDPQVPDEEPVATAPPGAKEFANRQAVLDRVQPGKGKNHERRVRWGDIEADSDLEKIIIGIAYCMGKLSEDTGLSIEVNMPYDIADTLSPILRDYDIPINTGTGMAQPGHIGMRIVTPEGDE